MCEVLFNALRGDVCSSMVQPIYGAGFHVCVGGLVGGPVQRWPGRWHRRGNCISMPFRNSELYARDEEFKLFHNLLVVRLDIERSQLIFFV